MVDLIFHPAGLEITDEVIERGEEREVEAMTMRVTTSEDLLVSKLMAMTEHSINYRSCLEIARALREQIDFADVRKRTKGSPFGRAFFVIAEGSRDRLGSFSEPRDLAEHRERLERVRLDLPDPLAREAELLADRLERHRLVLPVEPVAKLEHPALTLGELVERLAQRLLAQPDLDLLLGVPRLGGEEVAEASRSRRRRSACRGSSPRGPPP